MAAGGGTKERAAALRPHALTGRPGKSLAGLRRDEESYSTCRWK